MESLEDRIKAQARALGFDPVGIARATEADDFARLQDWLARGYAGEMDYLHRHAAARRHPAAVLPDVKSVVMVGMGYGGAGWWGGEVVKNQESPPVATGGLSPPRHPATPPTAKVARYARGPDYHDVLRDRLNRLLAAVQREAPGCRGRGVVDTAPLLERDFARRAGLGWIGKNTMLIHPRLGSFFFLGALLLDVTLAADAPFEKNHCGTCTRCLDACPTDAFPAAGWLDS